MSTYTLTMNTTHACNMGCPYCLEKKTAYADLLPKYDVTLLISRVHELLASDKFNAKFDEGIKLNFWGGEPTENLDYILSIINEFADHPKVNFMIYTNGVNFDALKQITDVFNDKACLNRIHLQISYDGEPFHSKYRKLKDGTSSSGKLVRDNILKLRGMGVNVFIKSTIVYETLFKLDEVWDDICTLSQMSRADFLPALVYAPEIDVNLKEAFINEDTLASINAMFRKIAKKELGYYQDTGEFLMSWFERKESADKATCLAGSTGSAIDLSGDIFFCHGEFYNNDKDINALLSIHDDEFVSKIITSTELYDEVFKVNRTLTDPMCESCVATHCSVCNAFAYRDSNKEKPEDRWNDTTTMKGQCIIYKEFGKINRALIRALNHRG